MCTYFKVEFAVVQNMIDDVFLTLTVRGPFHRKGKNKFCMLNLTKRVETPTSRYSATGNFLSYIYSVLVACGFFVAASRLYSGGYLLLF